MKMQVKTEVEGIYRDLSNGALVNKDQSALEAYKKIKKKNSEIEEMKARVNSLESDISQIKTLLIKLVEKV